MRACLDYQPIIINVSFHQSSHIHKLGYLVLGNLVGMITWDGLGYIVAVLISEMGINKSIGRIYCTQQENYIFPS